MFWRIKGNEKNNVNKELVLHISSLELELTNYRDKVQTLEKLSKQQSEEVRQFKKTIAILKQLEGEKSNKVVKDEMSKDNKSQKIKSWMEEFEEDQKETREITIQVLGNEIAELKRRLNHYVEGKQEPLDHYEHAITNYKGISIPIKAPRINGYDRYAIEKLLPQEVYNTKSCRTWEKIKRDFGYRCAITGVKYYEFEHFIPIHTGHGGAYEGNIIPLNWSYNNKKRNKNPFYWFTKMSSISLKRWDDLIGYLAEKNNLSVEEYIEFVNWCFNNPRTIEQLKMVNTPSLELWKHSKTIIL